VDARRLIRRATLEIEARSEVRYRALFGQCRFFDGAPQRRRDLDVQLGERFCLFYLYRVAFSGGGGYHIAFALVPRKEFPLSDQSEIDGELTTPS
jgi:hypothetical protein